MDNSIESFFKKFPILEFKRAEVILAPGDNPEGLYFLSKGMVRQYDISDSGNVLIVNVFKEGTHFPMPWLINNQDNLWYFEAVNDVQLMVAPKEEALSYFKNNHQATWQFLERLLSGATGQQRRMAHLMGGGAYTRVLYELTVQFKRFGKETDGKLCISISEAEIGSSAGLSREAVSRELTKLKEKELLESSYKKVCVKDVQILEEELGFSV